MRRAKYGKGICPRCGVNRVGPTGYCRECSNRYQAERRAAERRRRSAGEEAHSTPRQEWDLDMLRALVEVLRRIEVRVVRDSRSRVTTILVYRGKVLKA